MMEGWVYLVIGLAVGGFIGFVGAAMLSAASRADERGELEQWRYRALQAEGQLEEARGSTYVEKNPAGYIDKQPGGIGYNDHPEGA